ncbi:MAG TPA: hypothetical protein DEP48_01010 [Persephonella sp.]|uniref:Uncharacterized protein n=1 Tax=Persephonella marina (strain DSM 14350 / EX-H1) TaxID=123214 RepID=C0QR71_PERMH|nr:MULTISPECIES: hypothetical protein [Persephonella]ACO04901.1 hypothetical protein PERMA_1398 [Persephonella marina EX-H1]HCB68914.1 hypothetical protein [Persephonella sp.]
MGKNNLYVEYLLGDLESYIISQKAEINSIINEKKELTLKDSAFIFDRFSKSLKKTTDLIKHINEVEDAHLLKHISIITSETLAWILFTLPMIETNIPIFMEDLFVKNRHIVDAIGELLIQFEETIDQPSKIKEIEKELLTQINDISMTISSLSEMIQKGSLPN